MIMVNLMNKSNLINTIINYDFDLEESCNINSYLINNFENLIQKSTFKEITLYINNSWFTMDIIKNILPSLKILFKEQREKYEIQCSISILIPQFEKIIRVLCQQNNISTTNKGREEKTIGILLQNREIKKILGKNWKYIKNVLLKDGLDLRDKFAHGLDYGLYNEKTLEILFILIIKLTDISN